MSKFMYDFIHSLSMREKVYFKRFSKVYSNSNRKNYLRVYDAIENMTYYQEDALIKIFENESIGKYLSSELNYLFEIILKSLTNYYLDSTPKTKLQKLIIFIDILMEKGFSRKALKLTSKAKKLSIYHEEFTLTLKLIQNEEEILFKEGILGFADKLSELQLERQLINDQIRNLNELRLLRERARELQFTEGFVVDTELYPHIFNAPLMESIENAISIKAKEHWYYIYEFRYYITREYKKGLIASNAYIDFMEANIHLIKESKILSTISNNLLFAALIGDKTSFSFTFEKLVKYENHSNLDQIYIKYIKFTRQIELFYFMNKIEETLTLFEEMSEFAKENIHDMEPAQANYLCLLLIRTAIGLKRYNDGIDWMNEWNKLGSLDNTLVLARIFSLILHLELGWKDLLGYEVESTYKILRKHNKYNELPRMFIRLLKKHLKTKKGYIDFLSDLKPNLEQIKNDPTKNGDFEYFDVLKWCNNRIESCNIN